MLRSVLVCVFWMLTMVPAAYAQLNRTFSTLFDKVLIESLALSPGAHGQHYLDAAREANSQVTPALNSLIASNIASFPLSTTVAGVTFDFSTGQPVPIVGSQGPILAETAETLGERKFVIGFNATHLSLNSIRGMPLDEMRFTFFHEDVNRTGTLGDDEEGNESDVIDVFPDLDVNANIFALYGTFGVTPNLDVSIAIPFVDISLNGNPRAVVQSFTFGALGQANHQFGADVIAPVLVKDTGLAYSESAAGIGDIALRFKWRFPFEASFDSAFLVDVRVPTGDEANFLGTGKVSARGLLLASRTFGDFSPHFNVGYDYRGADLDSDEIEFVFGFDQKITEALTFALDFLGEIDLQKGEAIKVLPGTTTVFNQVRGDAGQVTAFVARDIPRSNIPDQDFDHTLNAAVGFKIVPTERLLFLANLLIPMQDDGLRSSAATTVGFSLNF